MITALARSLGTSLGTFLSGTCKTDVMYVGSPVSTVNCPQSEAKRDTVSASRGTDVRMAFHGADRVSSPDGCLPRAMYSRSLSLIQGSSLGSLCTRHAYSAR